MARAGGVLAASAGPLISSINSQIDFVAKQIDIRKRLEEAQRANAAAETAASGILLKALETQKYNGEQLLIQRDEEIRSMARPRKRCWTWRRRMTSSSDEN